MFTAIAIGSALGFLSAIPVAGPISALVLSYGVNGKYTLGRWLALGAGVMEGIYTFVAFWSFQHFLTRFKFMLIASNGVAVVILAFLGVYFFRSKSLRATPKLSNRTHCDRRPKAFFTGVGVSAANPSLIATWTAAATSLYSAKLFEFNHLNYLLFSAGVFVGIYGWFTLMLGLIKKHRNQLNPSKLDKALKGFGIFLIGFATYLAVRMVLSFG